MQIIKCNVHRYMFAQSGVASSLFIAVEYSNFKTQA